MLTRTDSRRFPILLAVIAALAMAMLFSTVQAQEGSAPDKPRGLQAAATHDSVTLTWDDPGDDSITGYVILRRVRVNDTGGDFDVLVADTETAALTYTDDTVAASLTYTYRIKAINEHGVSKRSRWLHIDVPADSAHPSPIINKANVSEGDSGCSSVGGNSSTCGNIVVGGVVTGNISSDSDEDWYRVELKGGVWYQVDARGDSTRDGTLRDPQLYLRFSGGSQSHSDTWAGYKRNARLIFKLSGSGVHTRWIEVNGRGDRGTYTLSVNRLDKDYRTEQSEGRGGESDSHDYSNNTSTDGRIGKGVWWHPSPVPSEVGVVPAAFGYIKSSSDKDAFKISLQTGRRYQVDVEGQSTGQGSLVDPKVTVYKGSFNSSGRVAQNDNVVGERRPGNKNSRVFFVTEESGTYYISVEGRGSEKRGSYRVTVRDHGAYGGVLTPQ